MYTEIKQCRICGNDSLVELLNLGNQALTGIFPPSRTSAVGHMPLELVKCSEKPTDNPFGIGSTCGLVQLKHTGNLSEFYGSSYGYRSGLNQSMVKHLHGKVRKILTNVDLQKDDLVVDIGSNDSTLLQGYPKTIGCQLVGIDPTGVKFHTYYPEHIHLIPNFFSAALLKEKFGNKKAKIITSISMFYDLEKPLDFMQDIHDSLDDHGVWVAEQSYLPTMLKMNSYDTICHEHLEYYSLKQIYWMAKKVGLRITDVEFNSINGGSFSVTMRKLGPHSEDAPIVESTLLSEKELMLHELTPYTQFKSRIESHRVELLSFLENTKKEGKVVFGYGASTKGNVLLQYCGINETLLPFIAEVNESKFGCFTPGTNIPILSETEAKKLKPDYFLVLPWHFKENIIEREQNYLQSGGKLVFPLPTLTIV